MVVYQYSSPLLLQSLTDSQAAERLIQEGLNELPQSQRENFWFKVLKILKEPMLLLLIIGGAVYLMIGDLQEGLMLGFSTFVVIGISIYQERRSEKALTALRELSSPRALVIRSAQERRIAATQIVPGDLVVLHEGDRVPADGIVLQSSHLKIDESLLTGESFAVQKSALQEGVIAELFNTTDNVNKVFSSTLVVSGTAVIRIVRTGASTEVGKIGKSLQEAQSEELLLSKEVRQIVKVFAWSGAFICTAIILIYGFKHGQWVEAFLVGLATEMSLLPEEFPVVLTVFLAMGAWRLSRVQVLVRKPGAIERLGATTVLCVDKTGTLTENRMRVGQLYQAREFCVIQKTTIQDLPEKFHDVMEYAVLASYRDHFDPMEKAILNLVKESHWGKDHLHQDWELIRDYPLSHQLLAMSCIWKDPKSESYVIASKGAPEAVADLCHLTPEQTHEVLSATQKMAREGLRVLGVARASFAQKKIPLDQHEFEFQWLGLIGLEDPLRPEVPKAIRTCREAGIRVIMMTGDYPDTALRIAEQAGIQTEDALITGSELEKWSDFELSEHLKTAHIFARMIPEQKLRIVQLLKNMHHVVAMTGDGVNDAPSLKRADVGIAMGARGTDVAREASDMVLIDDHFASIVEGIRRGRMIFNNIRKAMSYIVSIHIPIAGLSILPVLFNWPLILFPVHIVFLELIIDPACSLIFESQAAEERVMQVPPRSLDVRLFSMRDLLKSVLQGALVLGVLISAFIFNDGLKNEHVAQVRSLVFTVLVMSNVGLIFANMNTEIVFQKLSHWLIMIGITLILFCVTQVSVLKKLFHFGLFSVQEFMISAGIALSVFVIIRVWNKIISLKS